ncbi:MAG: redox-regulated ATPase YchF [Parcubacteria group bacterium]|jgi:hypothetical protein
MGLQVGIVGLPNVGKSTLFKALTQKQVDISNYPFCTIEPNVGVVTVPDERLQRLADLTGCTKLVPTIIEFVDIAGLVKGASEGEGLGNKFLANIRQVDAIVQVVRVFVKETITHVHDIVDPERDIEIIEMELILADMVTVDKTLVRLEKLARGNDKDAPAQKEIVQKIKDALDSGKLARTVVVDLTHEPTKKIIQEMSLLTMKPIMYVYNVSDLDAALDPKLLARPHVALDIKIEEELMEMSKKEAEELGMRSHLQDLITKSFELLGLQTFLTTGEVETRAWTIKKGSTAPEAGAAIHNDFKDRFIRADVVNWEKLIEAGSWSKARDTGVLRTVGKDYIMQEGDVVEFKV